MVGVDRAEVTGRFRPHLTAGCHNLRLGRLVHRLSPEGDCAYVSAYVEQASPARIDPVLSHDPAALYVFFIFDLIIGNSTCPENREGFEPGRPFCSVVEFVFGQSGFKSALGGLTHVKTTLFTGKAV